MKIAIMNPKREDHHLLNKSKAIKKFLIKINILN